MKHRRMFAHALFRVALFSLLLPLAASSHAASTNVAAPIVNWSNLGAPTESPSGVFTFTVLQATNYPQRFYRVTTPWAFLAARYPNAKKFYRLNHLNWTSAVMSYDSRTKMNGTCRENCCPVSLL